MSTEILIWAIDPDTPGATYTHHLEVRGEFYAVTALRDGRPVGPNDGGFADWVWDNAAVLVTALGAGEHTWKWEGTK